VAAMEDVLEVYHRPYNEQKPVICMDEQPVQLRGKKREAVPMKEHHSKREDTEYVRKGTCSVFMFVEPLGERRYVSASSRTRQIQPLPKNYGARFQGSRCPQSSVDFLAVAFAIIFA
jgi:hypothetical protein